MHLLCFLPKLIFRECINLKNIEKCICVLIANLRCEFARSEPPSSWSLSAFFVKKNKKLIYAVINIRGHIFYKVQSGGALHLSATDSLPFFATPLKHHLAKCCLLLVNILPLLHPHSNSFLPCLLHLFILNSYIAGYERRSI